MSELSSMTTNTEHPFLYGGGEAGELIRSIDWSSNTLGSPDNWPIALKQATSMMLLNTFPVSICWGEDYIQLYNDAYRPILGTSKYAGAMGSSAKASFIETWETIGPMFERVRQGGEVITFQNLLVPLNRNGQLEPCYFDFCYSPIKDELGNIGGIIVVCMETTEKVVSMERLRISRENLRNMVKQAPIGMCILKGKPFIIEEVNDRFLEIIDKDKTTFNEHTGWEPDIEMTNQLNTIIEEVRLTGKTFRQNEQEISKAYLGEMQTSYVDFVYEPIRDDDGNITSVMILATDVTDKVRAKKTTEANAINSARLAAIVESSDDAIISKTLESVITSWNAAAERMFGYTAEEMIGETIYKLIPPDRHEEEPEILARLKSGERVQHFETRRLMHDGNLIDVSLTISPVKDDKGNIIGLSKIARDITERKQDEQRKNDFIGMASHELKTPLTSLKAMLQILEAKFEDSDDDFTAGALAKSSQQVNRMVNIINGFLNISRFESGKMVIEKRRLNLVDLINDVMNETQFSFTTHHIHYIPCEPLMIEADYDKISSVIINLISNAVKYSPQGSAINLSCKQTLGKVIVSVQDQGMGIKAEDQEKLFQRYYRIEGEHTRNISGFGIGLYLCMEIIRRHDGKIWVESEPNKGSTFYFELPIVNN